jgi:hypothetical protein
MAPPIINIEFMKDQIQQWYLTDCETIDTVERFRHSAMDSS